MGYELCSPKLIDAVLAEVFDKPLSAVSFQKTRHRFYVRSRIPEVNDFIELWRDRLDINFLWGLSLNFVPHITNGVENVRWHRTSKSAHRDLSYSGFGRQPQLGWSICATRGEKELRRSALVTLREMFPKALKLFDSVKEFHDLEAVFEARKVPNEFGWTFDMYTEVSLAYAFYLAKSGRKQEARDQMSRWLKRHAPAFREETMARVSELFKEATRTPFV